MPIDYSGLAFPKGATRKSEQRRKKKTRTELIAEVRRAVWKRDRVCRYTRQARPDDEMHEIVSRAKLRGRPITELFSMSNCIRLSRDTHREVTEHRLRIEPLTTAGADGLVEFVNTKTGEISKE
jgi:hypothetical protein